MHNVSSLCCLLHVFCSMCQCHWVRHQMLYDDVQEQGVLPAGTPVSALLIGDLGGMPVLEDLPMIMPLRS